MDGRIIGIDEAGRGPWAGPLVACALNLKRPIDGLKDSKKLTQKQREKLFEIIMVNSAIGLGWVYSNELDRIGLSEANSTAMKRAWKNLDLKASKIIIDGSINYLAGIEGSQAVVKADDKYPEVSAASIVAKVVRDRYMVEMSELYPGYGFEKHKGYGTKRHIEALQSLGPAPIHRLSFKPLSELV